MGLDLTNREHLLHSAAVGLSILGWRNTDVEDAHCNHIPDDVMLRANVATASTVRALLDEMLPVSIMEQVRTGGTCP